MVPFNMLGVDPYDHNRKVKARDRTNSIRSRHIEPLVPRLERENSPVSRWTGDISDSCRSVISSVQKDFERNPDKYYAIALGAAALGAILVNMFY